MLLALLLGCSAYEDLLSELEDPPTPPCDQRQAWYADLDGDGLGSSAEAWISCDAPSGWVGAGGDCDDADPAITLCDTGGDTGGDTGTHTGTDTGADTAVAPRPAPR